HTSFSRDWSSDVCSSDLIHSPGTYGSAPFPADVQPVSSPAPVRRTAADPYVPGEWIVEVAEAPVQPAGVRWDDAGVRTVEKLSRSEERRGGEECSSGAPP